MEYADTIKEIRKKCFLSQEDLARELGVSFASINRWERGKTKPSKMALKAIEEFCVKHELQLVRQMDGGVYFESK